MPQWAATACTYARDNRLLSMVAGQQSVSPDYAHHASDASGFRGVLQNVTALAGQLIAIWRVPPQRLRLTSRLLRFHFHKSVESDHRESHAVGAVFPTNFLSPTTYPRALLSIALTSHIPKSVIGFTTKDLSVAPAPVPIHCIASRIRSDSHSRVMNSSKFSSTRPTAVHRPIRLPVRAYFSRSFASSRRGPRAPAHSAAGPCRAGIRKRVGRRLRSRLP